MREDLWLRLPLASEPSSYRSPPSGCVRVAAVDAVVLGAKEGSQLVVGGQVLWSPLAPDEVIARLTRAVAGVSHPEDYPR